MSANHELAFQCCTYCLIANEGPFEDVEHFSFEQWSEVIDTLRDLQLNVQLYQRDKKSADAAAD